MKIKFSILVSLMLSIFLMAAVVCAQEDEASIDYSWGSVVSVSSKEIVVSEYDYDTDKESTVKYDISSDVELNGIGSVSDLKEGDMIELSYMLKDGQKVVTGISLDQSTDFEEESDMTVDTEEISAEESYDEQEEAK